MSRKYEFAFFFITFRHFYGGSDNRYNRPTFDNFGPSVPRRAASPVKLQKRWYFFTMFYVIGLHFGTGVIGVNLTHFVMFYSSRQAEHEASGSLDGGEASLGVRVTLDYPSWCR